MVPPAKSTSPSSPSFAWRAAVTSSCEKKSLRLSKATFSWSKFVALEIILMHSFVNVSWAQSSQIDFVVVKSALELKCGVSSKVSWLKVVALDIILQRTVSWSGLRGGKTVIVQRSRYSAPEICTPESSLEISDVYAVISFPFNCCPFFSEIPP